VVAVVTLLVLILGQAVSSGVIAGSIIWAELRVEKREKAARAFRSRYGGD